MLTRFDDYRWQITTANRLIVEIELHQPADRLDDPYITLKGINCSLEGDRVLHEQAIPFSVEPEEDER